MMEVNKILTVAKKAMVMPGWQSLMRMETSLGRYFKIVGTKGLHSTLMQTILVKASTFVT